MNFKTVLVLAGSLAIVSASSMVEKSADLAEASTSQEMAQVEKCGVSPKVCMRCQGAPKRRAAYWKRIVSYRNAQRAKIAAYWRQV